MKKIILFTIISVVLLSGCTVGGIVEANQLEGTWVSENRYDYFTNNASYYVFYDFKPQEVELFTGDQTGIYRIRAYNDNFWDSDNYDTLETGYYTTDFLSGTISIIPDIGQTRILDYTLTDDTLILVDFNWWSSSSLVLRKRY